MQIISNIALISINGTLLFQIVSFLIFLLLINRILFRPLRKAIDERETYIENTRKDIIDANNKFERLSAQIRKQERAAKNEAYAQKEKLEESANKQADEILAAARKEISVVKDKAQKEIDTQIAAARDHIRKESEDLGIKIIETVLHRSLKA